jgi:hypothetical protein
MLLMCLKINYLKFGLLSKKTALLRQNNSAGGVRYCFFMFIAFKAILHKDLQLFGHTGLKSLLHGR